MAKLTVKYQIPVPFIPMSGKEVLKFEPIKLQMSGGEVTIYPPGHKNRRPKNYIAPEGGFPKVTFGAPDSKLWTADTLWLDVETSATPDTPEEERHIEKIERETHTLIFQLLRLLRRILPETPVPLPKELLPTAVFQWEPKREGEHFSVVETVPFIAKVVSPEACLTEERWEELRQQMSSGEKTELWEEFILDAKVALDEDDLNRATIYAAIACEVFIKNYTEKAKEGVISDKAWKRLKDRQPRVLEYYDSILHLVTNHSLNIEQEELYKSMQQLFTARNKIMHKGETFITQKKSETVKDMLKKAESTIAWVSSLRNKEKT